MKRALEAKNEELVKTLDEEKTPVVKLASFFTDDVYKAIDDAKKEMELEDWSIECANIAYMVKSSTASEGYYETWDIIPYNNDLRDLIKKKLGPKSNIIDFVFTTC